MPSEPPGVFTGVSSVLEPNVRYRWVGSAPGHARPSESPKVIHSHAAVAKIAALKATSRAAFGIPACKRCAISAMVMRPAPKSAHLSISLPIYCVAEPFVVGKRLFIQRKAEKEVRMRRCRIKQLLALTAASVVLSPTPAMAGGGGGPCPEESETGPRQVLILDNCFTPQQLQIDTGQAVRWDMQGNLDHTVTFRQMSSGDVKDSFSARFNEPGIYEYQCIYHPGMLGAVEVTGNPVEGDPIEALTETRPAEAFTTSGSNRVTQASVAGQATAAEVEQIELKPSRQAWIAIAVAVLAVTVLSSLVATIATRLVRR